MRRSLLENRKYFEYDFLIDEILIFLKNGMKRSSLRCNALPNHENGHPIDSKMVNCCNFKCVEKEFEGHYFGVLHGCPPTNLSGCVTSECYFTQNEENKWVGVENRP